MLFVTLRWPCDALSARTPSHSRVFLFPPFFLPFRKRRKGERRQLQKQFRSCFRHVFAEKQPPEGDFAISAVFVCVLADWCLICRVVVLKRGTLVRHMEGTANRHRGSRKRLNNMEGPRSKTDFIRQWREGSCPACDRGGFAGSAPMAAHVETEDGREGLIMTCSRCNTPHDKRPQGVAHEGDGRTHDQRSKLRVFRLHRDTTFMVLRRGAASVASADGEGTTHSGTDSGSTEE